MKPPEILGMIEEAAGTRMFEHKKQSALKTIEKKQIKVRSRPRAECRAALFVHVVQYTVGASSLALIGRVVRATYIHRDSLGNMFHS